MSGNEKQTNAKTASTKGIKQMSDKIQDIVKGLVYPKRVTKTPLSKVEKLEKINVRMKSVESKSEKKNLRMRKSKT